MRWLILTLMACNGAAIPGGNPDLAMSDLAGPSCAATLMCLQGCESLHACQDFCKSKVGPGAAGFWTALDSCLEAPCNTPGPTVPPCDSYSQANCLTCIQQNCATQAAACLGN